MDRFTFSYPTKVYFGKGSAGQAFEKEHSRMGKTVMLAYGGPTSLCLTSRPNGRR